MLLNVKYPRYDWTSEYYAVKGGAVSVLATVGVGLVLSAVPVSYTHLDVYKRQARICSCDTGLGVWNTVSQGRLEKEVW